MRYFLHRAISDGGWNCGFLGAQPLPVAKARRNDWLKLKLGETLLAALYDFETRNIVDRFLNTPTLAPVITESLPVELRDAANVDLRMISAALKTATLHAPPLAHPPSFSIIIPYYRHFAYLQRCLQSIAQLQPGEPFEIIVVIDDPLQDRIAVENAVPRPFKARTRILQNTTNRGIVATLNRAIGVASLQWILFVDCDDELAPHCLHTLHRYIENHTRVRYITSCMTDVDEFSNVLRYRRRIEAPTTLPERGMLAGHLKAIRRDAFDELGLLEESFNGCQDYEFALRISLVEPILSIPEYLYRYRWHQNTQSVSQANRQAATTDSVLLLYRFVVWAARQSPVPDLAPATTFLGLSQVPVDRLVRLVGTRESL